MPPIWFLELTRIDEANSLRVTNANGSVSVNPLDDLLSQTLSISESILEEVRLAFF